MGFRDDNQIREVCDVLLIRAQISPGGSWPLWWSSRETAKAAAWLDSGAGSNAQRALVGTAFALWNGYGDAPIRLLLSLDRGNLAAVAGILADLNDGPSAVDAWLAAQRRELVSRGLLMPEEREPAPGDRSSTTQAER